MNLHHPATATSSISPSFPPDFTEVHFGRQTLTDLCHCVISALHISVGIPKRTSFLVNFDTIIAPNKINKSDTVGFFFVITCHLRFRMQ